MVNWFGPDAWDSGICKDAPRCDIPVGVLCTRCRRDIAEQDSGVTMPGGSDGPAAFHLACHLKGIVPHNMWYAYGLVPDERDGLEAGRWYCPHCGMSYSTADGWSNRTRRFL